MNPPVFDAEKEIQCQVAAILARRPQLEGLVKPFAALFIEKSRLAGDLKAQLDSTQLHAIGNRLAEGVPILSGLSFSFLKPALDHAFTALLPTVKAWFPAVAPELERIEIEQRNAALDLSHLAEEYLGGGPKGFRGNPLPSGVDRRGLGFIVHLALSSVLQAMAPSLADRLMDIDWNRGYCPVCGSLPFMSYLSKSQNASSEFLVGGGGQRYLHCAVCAHDWHVRRHLCVACEKDHSDQHLYLQVADAAGERVDVCPHCAHYLPCIDLREIDLTPHLDTLAFETK
ncbi:MAG: formate dehydrogenase accessory protein FdhE [Desulfobacterales bacterium]|jgi:FdhE protein|nr:formate dehydrogenase accessory protein FdhE [Desulfobacterales bacterium]